MAAQNIQSLDEKTKQNRWFYVKPAIVTEILYYIESHSHITTFLSACVSLRNTRPSWLRCFHMQICNMSLKTHYYIRKLLKRLMKSCVSVAASLERPSVCCVCFVPPLQSSHQTEMQTRFWSWGGTTEKFRSCFFTYLHVRCIPPLTM